VRRRAPRPLGIAVDAFAANLAPATPLARVQRVWAQAVGEAVAREADPIAVRDSTLTVACRSAVWAHELDLMSGEVVAALNDALGGPVLEALRCRADGGAIRR
jgi:predicted nucleic acid-binding Zn ribbon protein